MPEQLRPEIHEEIARKQTAEAESAREVERELARIEIIGDTDPSTLSEEEFNEKAWLFHAARDSNFRVEGSFDYSGDKVDMATLGYGLYTTASREQADNYAIIRPQASVHKLMPYQARVLNLTSAEELRNLSFPKELAQEWVAFATPRIEQRIQENRDRLDRWSYFNRLQEIMHKLATLNYKEKIDLRNDILNTQINPFSVIEDIWQAFCVEKGIEGIIYVEGGEQHFANSNDRTYIFYNLAKVGTYADWRQRNEQVSDT